MDELERGAGVLAAEPAEDNAGDVGTDCLDRVFVSADTVGIGIGGCVGCIGICGGTGGTVGAVAKAACIIIIMSCGGAGGCVTGII